MVLDDWQRKWGIGREAVADLRRILGVNTDPDPSKSQYNEAAIQTLVRLEASRNGSRLWRNNVGACYTADGGFVRYGLVNESERLNKSIKSSDLIGIQPVTITKADVGKTFGQFCAREIKAPGWVYRGKPRERAQLKFLELITSLGGDARFATGQGSF